MSIFQVRSKFELTLPAELQFLGIDTNNVVLPLDEDPATGYYRNKWDLTYEQALEHLELIAKWVDINSGKIPVEFSFTAENDDVSLSLSPGNTNLDLKSVEGVESDVYQEYKESCQWFYNRNTIHDSVYDIRKVLMLPMFRDNNTICYVEIYFRNDCWKAIQHAEYCAKVAQSSQSMQQASPIRMTGQQHQQMLQFVPQAQPSNFGPSGFVPTAISVASIPEL